MNLRGGPPPSFEYEFASLPLSLPAQNLPLVPDLIINSIHIEWRDNRPKDRSVGSTQLTRPVDPGHRGRMVFWAYTSEKWPGSKIYLCPHHFRGSFFSDLWSRASFERNNFFNVCIFWGGPPPPLQIWVCEFTINLRKRVLKNDEEINISLKRNHFPKYLLSFRVYLYLYFRRIYVFSSVLKLNIS